MKQQRPVFFCTMIIHELLKGECYDTMQSTLWPEDMNTYFWLFTKLF